jgi:hypothetical protein
MGLKQKEMHLRQKAYFEQGLKDRLSFLAGKGIDPLKADKDTLVRGLKANIRAVNYRLNMIAANAKRTEETAKMKAEKAAARLIEQEDGKAEKPKKVPEAIKEKKIKAEKKPAPPKVSEDAQSLTPARSPEEGKATTEK